MFSIIKLSRKIHPYFRKEEAEKAERMETELRELKNLLKENVKSNKRR